MNEPIPVCVESPFAGDSRKNISYAKACMLDSIKRGEAPFLSHLLYTQVLNDNDPDERKMGMNAGFAIAKLCKKTVVYQDLGISDGMVKGILDAIENKREIEKRSIPNWGYKKFKDPGDLLDKICEVTNLPLKLVKSNIRRRDLAYTRHAFSKIAREEFPDITLGEIGAFINKNHTTAHRHMKEIDDVVEKKQEYLKIKKKLNLLVGL